MQVEVWRLIVIMIVPFILSLVISVVRWSMEEEEKRIRAIALKARIRQEEEAYHRALSEEITKQDKKDGAPEIVTQLNGKTVHSSISISSDGVKIESDSIDVGHASFSSIDAGHIAPSSSIEDVLMEKVEKKLAALGNIAVKESTNCPNCGAPFSGAMLCRYCGTKKS